MPVGTMLQQMSSRELTEWHAYAQLEPFGEERADLRQAITTAMIGNAHRDPKKGKAFDAYDFMPYTDKPEPEEPDPTSLRDYMLGLNQKRG